MKSKQKAPSPLHKKLLVFGVIAALIALIIGTAVFINSIITYPLGSQLHYIGKKDHGCIIGFCDTKPGSDFFYETDMSIEELERYFESAEVEHKEKLNYDEDEGISYLLTFKNEETDERFSMTLYYKGPSNAKDFGLETSKEHLLTIGSEDYEIAKTSL